MDAYKRKVLKDKLAIMYDGFCADIESELQVHAVDSETKSLVEEVAHRVLERFSAAIDEVVEAIE